MQRYLIKDITCEHCVAAITLAIQQLDTDAGVDVDIQEKIVSIDSTVKDKSLRKALKKAGYKAKQLK